MRFGADLWEALEHECARLGVSAAQHIREAAEERAYREGTEAAALAAQSRLVRQRARELRELAAKRRLG